MSRCTLYLIPPQRLLRAAEHAGASRRAALRRGHRGAARLWQQVQDRCLAALQYPAHQEDVVRRERSPLQEVALRQVEDALGPGALTSVRDTAREEVHSTPPVHAMCPTTNPRPRSVSLRPIRGVRATLAASAHRVRRADGRAS